MSKTGWSKGRRGILTLSKKLFQLLQHSWPLSTLNISVPCFPSYGLLQEISGLLWEQGGGSLCDRIYISASPSLGQHKTSTMQTEQLDLLESSQGPKKVQQWGADLSKTSLLEIHAATLCTIWGRDATCDIEIACTLQHFVVKTRGAQA